MQHSGIPSKTHQKGYAARYAETAVHRTFQIKTFSTELKNHVMVMDFVKSNWFPSQRRAKVCMIRMCQGWKTAEQRASRYEIHSRLFSPPRGHSAWERNESVLSTGLRDNLCSTNDQIALTNLQSDVTEKKPHFTEETLASQNTKMISSILISQLIDENKSRDNGAMLPLPCAITRPPAHRLKQSWANRSGVNIHRVFAVLPGRLGIPTPADERGPERELLPTEENPCGGPRKGFASITITARRVGPPAGTLVWGNVGGPLCPRCRAQDTLLQDPPTLAQSAHPRRHTEFSRNSSLVRLKVPGAQEQLCEGREYWVTHVGNKETSFSSDTLPSGKGPLVFSSCVHLRVSRQCPNSICYLDKPLSVPIEQTQIAGPQMHRSVLSLTLNCSSHRLTADGADGLANGEPIGRALRQELMEGSQSFLGPRWNPGIQESHLKENPSLGQVHLETGTCPWSGSPLLENTEFADVGTNQVTVRKGTEDHVTHCHPSGRANQLSIHIPGWSYTAGDYTCCDLVVKIKGHEESKDPPAPEPSPAPPKGPESPDPCEDCPEPQQTPANSLTLQEALEVRNPQFICRSQERLKKLEHMVQQRRAQRKENPGQKQSILPVRVNKKQFTVPHPLSDNLFKPKERCISEKEMHMRSKRIYNNLPEVKKKKEEQRKRLILQSNRLRAEVFKKQLLDQLLQRNAV
ncbi:(E2-independent) E3 ubiquitin-conjugating enzyme FATS isoform 3 [Daubentonia madagascariensis]|uniref:(E2-independent) E3 ubiquitin-conjugating enzyme FATS isoform 3 n=1 Tax=Daubentonia madagascariensis TaxID=31869 RepID=A0ABD2DQM9_DAUMA